ncbi:MAG: hypothetical protein NZP72_05370 [Geminicoccaceae bacterium]|nr:hypothetical protein [Geminicoccaceae bacterium]
MERFRTVYAALRALLALGVAHGAAASARAQSTDPERQLWDSVVREATPEAFQRYLDQYPLGRYATEAFRQLIARSLDSSVEPAAGPAAEPGRAQDLY